MPSPHLRRGSDWSGVAAPAHEKQEISACVGKVSTTVHAAELYGKRAGRFAPAAYG
jgi:hypothetical protein